MSNTPAAARATPVHARPVRRANSKMRPWPNAKIALPVRTMVRLASRRARRARLADIIHKQARKTASCATTTVLLAATTVAVVVQVLANASNAPLVSTKAAQVTVAASRAAVANTRALRALRVAVGASKGATKARAVRPHALTVIGLVQRGNTIQDVAAPWRVHALHAREGNSAAR